VAENQILTLPQAETLGRKAIQNDHTIELVKWFIKHLHDEDIMHTYPTKEDYAAALNGFLETWLAGLERLGLKGDVKDSTSDKHKAFRLYNRRAPAGSEALIYKLADKYQFLKERWLAETAPYSQAEHHFQGTIYDPPTGHTMPRNFAWIASVIHKQLPVRIVVPVDFRILIREAISERLAKELDMAGGKKK